VAHIPKHAVAHDNAFHALDRNRTDSDCLTEGAQLAIDDGYVRAWTMQRHYCNAIIAGEKGAVRDEDHFAIIDVDAVVDGLDVAVDRKPIDVDVATPDQMDAEGRKITQFETAQTNML
jgi:hypothetical protein